jgi:hypothetical protein
MADSASQLSLSNLLGASYNPRQPEFILAPEYEIAWVGGMGCGKTYALCVAALRHAARYPGAHLLISRLTFRELIDSTKKQFFEMVDNKKQRHLFEKPLRWDYREGTNVARLKNGSEIKFANLEPGKLDKLKNLEFSWVGIDQGEEIQFDTYQLLLQRCRLTAVPQTDRHVCVIANDEGDNWLRRRFLTYEAPHGRPTAVATRRLVRGTSLENPHLDELARAQLLSLPPEVQSRWVWASMDAGATRLIPDLKVIEPFEVPRHWPRWLGIDPARSTGVTCALWIAGNPDNVPYKGVRPNGLVFYDEYWVQSRDAETHADAINERTGAVRPRGRVMDRTAWHAALNSRSGGAVSVAQLYINAGLAVYPSEGDEWARVMLYLEADRRGLYVFNTCTNLIRQGPEYRIKGQHGVNGPLKIESKQKFHAIDAGGYALSTIPTKLTANDLRPIEEAYDIPEGLDRHSYMHWKRDRSNLPKRRGRESVVSLGLDEVEFNAPEGQPEWDAWEETPSNPMEY